jgi:hypothetical protein
MISKEDPRFWDVRMIERRIRKGLVTRKDVEKHVKSLPDSAEKGLTMEDAENPSASHPPNNHQPAQ